MMLRQRVRLTVPPLLVIFFLAGCATYGPPGPSKPAYIGAGKTQAQFHQDDANCRTQATSRAGDPGQVHQAQAASTIFGTLFGAALGAGIGAATGGGRGAAIGTAIGGATGAVGGISVGTAQAQADAKRIQHRWDGEYYGCMYNVGHQVPGGPAPAAQPAPVYAPPPPPTAPAQAAPPCKPTGKYVKTPQGFMPECG